jgi:Recombinase
MDKRYHNNTQRPAAYYEQVLRILIACNAEAMSYSAMAIQLNAQAIPTPTGLQWTSEHIKQLLKKLRAYKLYPSHIHQHLMELIFEGTLSVKESLPLLQSRRYGIA